MLLDLFKLRNLLKAVSSSLTMDQTLQPLTLAEQMQDLTTGNLAFTTIPTDGFHKYDGVGDTVVVHPDQVRAAVTALIKQTGQPAKPPAAPRPGVSHQTPAAHGSGSGPSAGAPASGSGSDVTTAQQAASGCID
jgi:hypothetical protein